ncbi:hypothetical protein J6590_007920 [Homalodisca vitripennis]|nr:hypothetical protein J6590_007920 [Homalodisca vitripennis]
MTGIFDREHVGCVSFCARRRVTVTSTAVVHPRDIGLKVFLPSAASPAVYERHDRERVGCVSFCARRRVTVLAPLWSILEISVLKYSFRYILDFKCCYNITTVVFVLRILDIETLEVCRTIVRCESRCSAASPAVYERHDRERVGCVSFCARRRVTVLAPMWSILQISSAAGPAVYERHDRERVGCVSFCARRRVTVLAPMWSILQISSAASPAVYERHDRERVGCVSVYARRRVTVLAPMWSILEISVLEHTFRFKCSYNIATVVFVLRILLQFSLMPSVAKSVDSGHRDYTTRLLFIGESALQCADCDLKQPTVGSEPETRVCECHLLGRFRSHASACVFSATSESSLRMSPTRQIQESCLGIRFLGNKQVDSADVAY